MTHAKTSDCTDILEADCHLGDIRNIKFNLLDCISCKVFHELHKLAPAFLIQSDLCTLLHVEQHNVHHRRYSLGKREDDITTACVGYWHPGF